MQVDVQELESCKLSVHCVADAGEIFNKRGEVLGLFKKAPVPGFRPGKASIDAIKIHYRDQIEEALKRALAEDAFHEALFQHKLKPHGPPRFSSLMMGEGKFTCDFELYTKPAFELAPYKNLNVPKPHSPQDPVSMAELMLQELRVRLGEVAPYTETDFVQSGDNVILDYEGSIDGQKVDHVSATGEMLTVGKSQLPIFDDNLLGMTMGDVREFDITVPNTALPSISGKTIHFKVTLTMGSKTTPCALDDTLAQKVGKKDFNELREYIYTMAAAKVTHNAQMAVNEAIANKLVDDNQVSVPNWMSLSEAQYLTHQAKLDWATLTDLDKEKYLSVAERNVKLSLILDKIRELEPEAQLTDQEVFEIVKKNLANTKVTTSLDDVIKEMNRTGYLQILFSRIRDEHALDFVVKSASVVE